MVHVFDSSSPGLEGVMSSPSHRWVDGGTIIATPCELIGDADARVLPWTTL